MKALTKILGIGALIIGLTGCPKNIQRGIYEDYPVEYHLRSFLENYLALTIYSKEKGGGKINFMDNNSDGRFDNIYLDDIRKGDPVERFANLETAQKIVESLTSIEEK